MSAFDINQLVLQGRLTREPEQRTTAQGMTVTSFGVANNPRGKDEKASFFDCTAFKQKAEFIGTYARKGSHVLIVGSIKQETWTDKNTGANRSKVGILVNDIKLLDPPNKQGNDSQGQAYGQPQQQTTYNQPKPQQGAAGFMDNNDMDIPF